MKLTKETLKRIIKEELENTLNESHSDNLNTIKKWAHGLMDARSVDALLDVVEGYMRQAKISDTDGEGKHTPEVMKRIPLTVSRKYEQEKIEQVVAGMISGLLDFRLHRRSGAK